LSTWTWAPSGLGPTRRVAIMAICGTLSITAAPHDVTA
jgi:hypothetical protein